jgi:hypothetical protein
MSKGVTARRIGTILFIISFTVFLFSPVLGFADSRYSLLLSESIIHYRQTNLNAYLFSSPVPEVPRCVSPPPPIPVEFTTYQLDRVLAGC